MQLRVFNIIFCVGITVAYYPFNIIAQSNNDQYAEFEKKLYFIGDSQWENWFNSWKFCASKGMKLLSLESARETNFLVELLKSEDNLNKRYWTSGNDLGQSGAFFWFGTGKKIYDFLYWKTGEPTGGDEHCIYADASNFRWSDFSCNAPARLICERELTDKELNSNAYQSAAETQGNTDDVKTTEATTTVTNRRGNRAMTPDVPQSGISEVLIIPTESTSPRLIVETTTSTSNNGKRDTHIGDITTAQATINQRNHETLPAEQLDAVITESTQEVIQTSYDPRVIPQVVTSSETSSHPETSTATTTTTTTATHASDDPNHRGHIVTSQELDDHSVIPQVITSSETSNHAETSTATTTTTTTATHASNDSNHRGHVVTSQASNDPSVIPQVVSSSETSIHRETSTATTTTAIHASDDSTHKGHVATGDINQESNGTSVIPQVITSSAASNHPETSTATTTTAIHASDDSNHRGHVVTSQASNDPSVITQVVTSSETSSQPETSTAMTTTTTTATHASDDPYLRGHIVTSQELDDPSVIPQGISSSETSSHPETSTATTTTTTTAIHANDDSNHRGDVVTSQASNDSSVIPQVVTSSETSSHRETSTVTTTTTTTAIHASDDSTHRGHVATGDINQESNGTRVIPQVITSSAASNHPETSTATTTTAIHTSDVSNSRESVYTGINQETTLPSVKRRPRPTTASTSRTDSTSYQFNRRRYYNKQDNNDDDYEDDYDARRGSRFFYRRRYYY